MITLRGHIIYVIKTNHNFFHGACTWFMREILQLLMYDITGLWQQPSKSYNFSQISRSHHTNSVWFWRVREKCQLRKPPCYFCVMACDTSISYIDCMISHNPPRVTRNSRLKMASLMAIAHHNVPYCTTTIPTHTIPYVLYYIK